MDIDEIKAEFRSRDPLFKRLETEATYILETALKKSGIKTHSLPTRVKTLDSFVDKVKRKDSKDPFQDIRDIVGLRVICLFLSDIPRVGDLIRAAFNVLSEDDKIGGAEISSFGYMSVHYVAEMKKECAGARYDDLRGMPFEIQVRTILMDAWANVSHYLDYKRDQDVPTNLRRDFYAVSGLFYIADSHFELFFRSSAQSRKQAVRLAMEAEPSLIKQELNLDTLAAYLAARLPDREVSDSKDYSDLIGQLKSVGYKTIGDVDRLLSRTADAFAAYERTVTRGNVFTRSGVVRISGYILSPEFARTVWGNNTPPSFTSYRKLVKSDEAQQKD
jgi:ppGpp synthetase/RelA/SpoT-type nucleotidyltranferase